MEQAEQCHEDFAVDSLRTVVGDVGAVDGVASHISVLMGIVQVVKIDHRAGLSDLERTPELEEGRKM